MVKPYSLNHVTFLLTGGTMIQSQKQKAPCPLSDMSPRGAGTAWRDHPNSSQPWFFNDQPPFQITFCVENPLPLTNQAPSPPQTEAVNLLFVERGRIKISPLYLFSFLPDCNIQPLCAGCWGPHRDESDTFLAREELREGRTFMKHLLWTIEPTGTLLHLYSILSIPGF